MYNTDLLNCSASMGSQIIYFTVIQLLTQQQNIQWTPQEQQCHTRSLFICKACKHAKALSLELKNSMSFFSCYILFFRIMAKQYPKYQICDRYVYRILYCMANCVFVLLYFPNIFIYFKINFITKWNLSIFSLSLFFSVKILRTTKLNL